MTCRLSPNLLKAKPTLTAIPGDISSSTLCEKLSQLIFLNGFKIKSLTIPSFPSLTQLNLLQYGNSRQYGRGYLVALWKTKLSDADATKLTAL